MNTIDIVTLIEDNPVTRLTGEYNNRFINKIKKEFTEEQQQLFVSSFYCYLNYHSTNDFVVDLDDVWKWLGFLQKVKAKELLERHFIKDKDYKLLLSHSGKQTDHTRGGHNKQQFLLNIKTFKLLCLKAATERANEIHEYYITLEQTLQDILNEETNELRLQLENKNKEIDEKTKELKEKDNKSKKEKENLREKTLLEQFPNNVECVYYGLIDNTNDAKEKLIKFGQSNNLSQRVMNHKKTYTNFRLVNAFRVENKQLIENEIKTHKILSTYRRSIIINNTNYTEILALNGITITNLDVYIKNIICSNQFTVENFAILLDENIKLKEDNLLLKEENEKLKIENKKLLKNYRLKIISKQQETQEVMNKEINDPITLLKKITKNKDGVYVINNIEYKILNGSRDQVWNGDAYRTSGGLVKDDLIMNKSGKVVSKSLYIAAINDNHLNKSNKKSIS
jgi:hypothetical protein